MSDPLAAVQRIVGFLAIMAFLVLAYFSMHPNMELTWPVIIGIVVLVAMTLGKLEQIAGVIEKYNTKRIEHQPAPEEDDE